MLARALPRLAEARKLEGVRRDVAEILTYGISGETTPACLLFTTTESDTALNANINIWT